MGVLLRRSNDLPSSADYQGWVGIGDVRTTPVGVALDVSAALEDAFDSQALHWLSIGHDLAADPGADLAHTPACVANASDFGAMLGWGRLLHIWSGQPGITLVVCDDPWLFRYFATIPGVVAGLAPPLLVPTLRLAIRGWLARLGFTLRTALRQLGQKRPSPVPGGSWVLSYAHPSSDSAGTDAYFGDLMDKLKGVRRVLHVDGRAEMAGRLISERTFTISSWGSIWSLFALPFARWRPSRRHRQGPEAWLIRRAACREGSTAQAAAIRWQQICQRRFIAKLRPNVVAWPWENHAWERDLVRVARAYGVKTIGYQHSVVGRQMLNYAPGSNPDGEAGLPDTMLCTGITTRMQLTQWGVPQARSRIAGARRHTAVANVPYDPGQPVFLALPFDLATAADMVEAARQAVGQGWRFLVKDHPMTPFHFQESAGISRVRQPLTACTAVRAVVYAATTVGLEALLMGLPTLRFRPSGRISLDILPAGVSVPVAGPSDLAEALANLSAPRHLDRDQFFASVDETLWADMMEGRTNGQ